MSMGWEMVWRGIHFMEGEAFVEKQHPGTLNIRYNGGLRPDGKSSKGYYRIVQNETWGYYTAEVWI